MRPLRFFELLLLVATIACTLALPARAGSNAFVPAQDTRLRYQGRVDATARGGVALIWQSTQVSLDFEGSSVAVVFASAEGQNFFDLRVDDRSEVIEAKPDVKQALSFSGPIGPGRHHLVLYKRSEAAIGSAVFAGVEIGGNAKAWAPAAPLPKLRFLFLGDSITAGACDEDGANDQWESRRTHNAAKSYAALTAEALNADLENISVSGMGIVIGYVDVHASQVWNRLYPKADAPLANMSTWVPDVVFLNYGENDTSFTQRHGQAFPATFIPDYVALVRAIRKTFPKAEIVLLRGGMRGCAENPQLRSEWNIINDKLETDDPRVDGFAFQHYSKLHPRVADHEALANELIVWLKKQSFVRK